MPWVMNVGEGAAERFEPDGNTVCISITEPGRKAKLPSFVDLIREQFQDYDPVGKPPHSPSGMYELHEPQAKKIPPNALLIGPSQAARIARFARKHRDAGRNILVHCAAGVSRSGAIADALLQAFPGYEDRGWPRFPNGHVRSLMKRALGLVPIGAEESA